MSEYPVFVKPGDALHEVDEALRTLGATPEQAGLHKQMYVTRADQTIVLVTDRDVPLADVLRERGWAEPREG